MHKSHPKFPKGGIWTAICFPSSQDETFPPWKQNLHTPCSLALITSNWALRQHKPSLRHRLKGGGEAVWREHSPEKEPAKKLWVIWNSQISKLHLSPTPKLFPLHASTSAAIDRVWKCDFEGKTPRIWGLSSSKVTFPSFGQWRKGLMIDWRSAGPP